MDLKLNVNITSLIDIINCLLISESAFEELSLAYRSRTQNVTLTVHVKARTCVRERGGGRRGII